MKDYLRAHGLCNWEFIVCVQGAFSLGTGNVWAMWGSILFWVAAVLYVVADKED